MYYLIVTFYNFILPIVERKGVFDKYGEFGLKEGVPSANGCKNLPIDKL